MSKPDASVWRRRREWAVLLGCALATIGLAGWDWRVAAVAVGVGVAAVGFIGIAREAG